jgi:hypothetical protein
MTTTLTATANTNVGPTPWYIEIFDTTTRAELMICSSGTSCSVNVSQSSGTSHSYVAFISGYGTSYPPPSIQVTSNSFTVTWLVVSLSASPQYLQANSLTTITATTNANVGPSPYYIEIFDTTQQAQFAICPSGTTCGGQILWNAATAQTFVAYISSYGTAYPPPNIQATSNSVLVYWFTVTLSASVSYLAPGAPTALTANAAPDVGPTPEDIKIFDTTTGALLISCISGGTCGPVNASSPSPATHTFIAYVQTSSGTTAATSSTVYVTWLGVTLTADRSSLADGASANLTATANTDLTPSPYSLELFDQTTGTYLNSCGQCSAMIYAVSQLSATTHLYTAYISTSSTSYPPPNIQNSASHAVTWFFWGVDSAASIIDTYSSVVTTYNWGHPDFWGRYIGSGNTKDMSSSEATFAHNNGLMILAIYENIPCNSGTYIGEATGKSYAAGAISGAQSLQIPAGVAIFIGIEPPATCGGSPDAGFIWGWFEGFVGSPYVAGYYGDGTGGSSFTSAYCSAVGSHSQIGSGSYVWSFEPSGNRTPKGSAPAFAPNQPNCANQTIAWQYAIQPGTTLPNVDTDEALVGIPLWQP